MKIVSKLKNAKQKVSNWFDKNAEYILGTLAIVSTLSVPAVIYWACDKQLKNLVTVKPNDIVRYSNGWMLLDAYEPNLYWPTKHGLSVEEIKQVGELIER